MIRLKLRRFIKNKEGTPQYKRQKTDKTHVFYRFFVIYTEGSSKLAAAATVVMERGLRDENIIAT
jgi:hypothetical protein